MSTVTKDLLSVPCCITNAVLSFASKICNLIRVMSTCHQNFIEVYTFMNCLLGVTKGLCKCHVYVGVMPYKHLTKHL